MSQRHLFVFGLGYSAQALIRKIPSSTWRVTGTLRGDDEKQCFVKAGVEIITLSNLAGWAGFGSITHLLITAGPGDSGDPMIANFPDVIAKLAPNLQWIGYLSTTGVYGDHQGEWVDETTPVKPATKRGKARVDAEQQWQSLCDDADIPLSIFRLAGIYGPGRGPFAKLRAGTARRIIKENQVFSRIHVEDIANVLEASMNRPQSSGIYNVCDDISAPPEDVIGYAADLLGLPIPTGVRFEDAEMTPMARSFYSESKKVRNDRIKSELGVELIFPNYEVGLRALLDTE